MPEIQHIASALQDIWEAFCGFAMGVKRGAAGFFVWDASGVCAGNPPIGPEVVGVIAPVAGRLRLRACVVAQDQPNQPEQEEEAGNAGYHATFDP